MALKYVIMDDGLLEHPVIFDKIINHNDMANCLPGKAVRAGFCYISNIITDEDGNPQYVCYGESTSLKLKSDQKKDAELINRMDRQ